MTNPNNRETQGGFVSTDEIVADLLNDPLAGMKPGAHFAGVNQRQTDKAEAVEQMLPGFEAQAKAADDRTDDREKQIWFLQERFIEANRNAEINEAFCIAGELMRLANPELKNRPILDYEAVCRLLYRFKQEGHEHMPELAAARLNELWPGSFFQFVTGGSNLSDGMLLPWGPRDPEGQTVVLLVRNPRQEDIELFKNLLPNWAARWPKERIPSPIFALVEFAMRNYIAPTTPSSKPVNMLPAMGKVSGADVQAHTMLIEPRRELLTPVPAEREIGMNDLPVCLSQVAWLRKSYLAAHKLEGVSPSFAFRIFAGTLLRFPSFTRDGGVWMKAIPTREFIQWFFPGGWNQRARDWPKFEAALQAINRNGLGMVETPDGWKFWVLTVGVIPPGPDEGYVGVHGHIPHQARYGARIPTDEWNECAGPSQSPRKSLLYLGIKTLVDRDARKGEPIRPGDDKGMKRVPTLTRRDMAYMGGATDPDDRRYQRRIYKYVEDLHNKGVITLIEGPGGYQILGPGQS